MKQKHLTETPVCPQERLVIISYTTGLSFALERIGTLAAIITIVFYLLALYLFALPNTPENPFASIYSESLIKLTCQHLLLLESTMIHPLYLWVIKVTNPTLHQTMKKGYAIRHSMDNNGLRGQKHNSNNPFHSPKLLIDVDLRMELIFVVELILLQKYQQSRGEYIRYSARLTGYLNLVKKGFLWSYFA
jgi:hypothetical protein